MPRMPRTVPLEVALAALLVALAAWPPKSAEANVVLSRLPDRNPWGGTCGMTFPPPLGLAVGSRWFPRDTGTEPRIVVNPRDPRHWVVAFIADFSVSQLVAVSRDAGRTWRQRTIPRLGRCTGGDDEGSFDPWLGWGPDGVIYMSYMVGELPRGGFTPVNAVAVSRSDDGGDTWSAPLIAEPNDRRYNDKPVLLVDPARPGRLLVLWTKRDTNTGSQIFGLFTASSSDGGATWSRRLAYAPGADVAISSSDILALPDGTWLHSFRLGAESEEDSQHRMATLRSEDKGLSWSGPQIVGRTPNASPMDPDDGEEIAAAVWPATAVAPDGSVYAVWHRLESTTASQIVISRSRDSGRTWSEPATVVDSAAQAFQPHVAVMPDGTVGVLFYDTRADRPGDGQLTTDAWVRVSRDSGRTWHEEHVIGPFDYRRAWGDPRAFPGTQFFIGDYFALAALPDGFAGVVGASAPFAENGFSDLYVPRVCTSGTSRPLAPTRKARLRVRALRRGLRPGRPRLRIRVSTRRGTPVSGARVRLGRSTAYSNRYGRVLLPAPRSGSARVRVDRCGYRSATVRLPIPL